jgi:integration host factor subunit beta
LVERIAARYAHLYQRDAERAVSAILDKVISALARGDRVELRGFGIFEVKRRKARTGRNPRTGGIVAVEDKNVLIFRSGKDMRQRLNREASPPRPRASP